MGDTLAHLAEWAVQLRAEEVPPDVLERARLQHLSTAGAIRSVMNRDEMQRMRGLAPSRGKAFLMALEGPPTKTSPTDALRFHTTAACVTNHVDNLFWGQPGPSIVPCTWANPGRATLDALLTATVIGNEVAARLGAATMFSPAPGLGATWVHAIGAAAAAARLAGLDAQQTTHAYALALTGCSASTWRIPFQHSLGRGLHAANAAGAAHQAVELARTGVQGPTHLLDRRGGLFAQVCYLPLRSAFTGLGQTWLTRTLAFPARPGSPFIQVPLQAVHEILRRHVKAADKRLRVQQLERIEIKTSILGCATEQLSATLPGSATLTHSISQAVGALVCAYEFGPDQVHPAWLEANKDEIAHVANRVEITHDWDHTDAVLEHLADVAAPLFAGLTVGEIKAAGERARHDFAGVTAGPPPLHHLLPGHRWLERLLVRARQSTGDLADLDERAIRYPAGTVVKLYTSRGGWWPERRDNPEGAPGSNWEETIAGIMRKFAAGTPKLREAAVGLLESDGHSTPARDWVSELLA